MVAWLVMGLRAMQSPLPFITESYLEGGVVAAGTGLLTGLAALFGANAWYVPVMVAVVVTLTFAAVGAPSDFATPDYWQEAFRVTRVFIPPSVAAAVVCWALTRRLFLGIRQNA